MERAARTQDAVTDLRLARLHLRMGQLSIARAELEALAGSGHLDQDGLLALAEVRWRTGDLVGAGEAAQAYLAMPGEPSLVGLVIAAESVAYAGRPGEARRIAGRVLEQGGLPLEEIFAGLPRSSIWPVQPGSAASDPSRSSTEALEAAPAAPVEPSVREGERLQPPRPETSPAAREILALARRDVADGRLREAGIRLAVALRLAPELAPDVIDLADGSAGAAPELDLVRGDALRLLGREPEARRSWAAAAALGPSAPPDAQRREDGAGR